MMAASVPRPPPTDAERERIRELSRYYCTIDHIPSLPQSSNRETQEEVGTGLPQDVRLSSDISLTALAQLGVLRFGCNRAFVSIIDDGNQHIIAEATGSISLRNKDKYQSDEAVYLGTRTIDLAWGVCPHTVALFTGQDMSNAADTPNMIANGSRFIVYDFTQEEVFKDRPYVLEWPYFRFYAEVPLYSPSGFVLGSFCIVDNKPRPWGSFGDEEVTALQEIADAVAQHLEKVRICHNHSRADKLVKGLTDFVKDLGEFDPTELPRPISRQPTLSVLKPPRSQPSVTGRGPTNDGGNNENLNMTGSTSSEVELSSLFSGVTCSEQTKTSSFPYNPPRSSTPTPAEDSFNSKDTTDGDDTLDVSVKRCVGISDQTAQIFARASVTLRDSMDLDGVLFLDASRCNSGVVPSDNDSGSWEPLPATANPEFLIEPVPSPLVLPGVGLLSKADEKPCEVLGSAQKTPFNTDPGNFTVTEALLNQMIVAFPQGHLFNLHDWVEDDKSASGGSLESDDQDSETRILRDICRQLYRHLPDAYSVLWSPLWCWRQSRWLAGTLVWSRGNDRALGMHELHYFKVLGHSIISEVARIDWSNTQQTKSDFISSVSHEIRSPLHGMLASAEVLEGTPLQPAQLHWLNMLKSCGLTLFDTLNHLLDFAKINNLTIADGTSDDQSRANERHLMTSFDLDTLIEEVTRIQYLGQRAPKEVVAFATPDSPTAARDGKNSTDGMTVVVRIAERRTWKVRSIAGAWRRIVMNLLGNSLKFTSSGFVEVSLSKVTRQSDPRSIFAHLSVTDTGCGIAPDFLKHKLFSPFAQENTLSEGLGLGFSIVRQLVESLGGHINVQSEVGVGTQVDVYIPVHPFDNDDALSAVASDIPITASLIGFNGYPDPKEAPTGILPAEAKRKLAIRSSLTPVLMAQSGWRLSLAESLEHASGDIAIVEEAEYAKATNDGQLRLELGEKLGIKYFIILSCTKPLLRDPLPSNVIRVSQPFGPEQFQAVLERVQKLYLESLEDRGTSPTPEVIPAVPQKPPPDPILLTSPDITKTTNPGLLFCAPQQPPEDSSKGIHVLIVDDNDINLKILATFVRKLGCSYDTASNGLIALNTYKASSRRYDFVLMDVSMPVMDGILSTSQIRRFEKKNSLPPSRIIAVTGVGASDTQQQALAAGMDDYMVKPVRLTALKKMMNLS